MPTDWTFNPDDPKTLRSIPVDGMTMYYPARFGPTRYCHPGVDHTWKDYERGFIKYCRGALTEDMLFLDIGANMGYYTLLAAGRVREVVAVEPNPSPRALLRENIRRNKLTNVTVIEDPLFSRVVRGNIGRRQQLRIHPGGRLETTTLDALGLAPAVIKIDASGSEYDILMGGKETLRRYAPTLLVEIYVRKLRRYGHKEQHVYRLLRSLGYKITELEKREKQWWIRAEK